VHRIGRTGRAGRTGTAITIVAGSDDAKAIATIEKLIGQPIPWMDGPAPEAVTEPRPSTSAQRERERPHRGRRSHRPTPASTSVAHIAQRPPQPPQAAKPRNDDGDASHLPAFLLRPVPLKA
jgi:superfamily II DNA/RNA helicase